MLGVFLLPLTPNINIKNEKVVLEILEQEVLAQGAGNDGDLPDPFGNAQDYENYANEQLAKTPKIVGDGIDFGCNFNPWSWVTNCVVALVYYAIFTPLAWITTGAAKILDYFVYYSTSDQSYRNVFVEKGWGTVRDIANVMFIVGLLFIAIKTILGLNTTNNKKMLGNIIIFALLINFSLFATQVIVDASNILAKVFYHQITPVDSNGSPIEGNVEQRSVTVGLTKTFDPQDIIVADADTWGQKDFSDKKAQFLLTTILSIILMCFMIYIFISVAFLFVARTVSIWLAMILAPIAFASNAIGPNIKGLGWNEWLSNLLKNAFMAPIFIFFLYIIILFGDIFALGGASVTGSADTNIVAFMGTFIPFMLVFVLLSKAKELAKSYSGEMGSAMTKLGGGLTALALGGAALGTAAIGRNTIGAVTKYARNDNTRDKDRKIGARWNELAQQGTINPIKYVRALGKGVSANIAEKLTTRQRDAAGQVQTRTWLGNKVTTSEKAFVEKKHSEHELDTKTSEMAHKWNYNKDIKFSELTDNEKHEVKEAIDKDIISKNTYKKKFESLEAFEAATVEKAMGTRNYNNPDHQMSYSIDAILKDPSVNGGFRNQNITKLTDGAETFTEHAKASGAVGEFVRALRQGSFDVRNLSSTKVASKGLGKLAVGIIAAVALGMRSGFKASLGSNYGTSSKDFSKDLGGLIKEALKDMKIDIKTESHGGGGGGHAKADHGGGHGGGGGHH